MSDVVSGEFVAAFGLAADVLAEVSLASSAEVI